MVNNISKLSIRNCQIKGTKRKFYLRFKPLFYLSLVTLTQNKNAIKNYGLYSDQYRSF